MACKGTIKSGIEIPWGSIQQTLAKTNIVMIFYL
jgi:hypothetical protein